jgi:hypothetical protein
LGQKEKASFSHFPEDEDKVSIQNGVLKRGVFLLDKGQSSIGNWNATNDGGGAVGERGGGGSGSSSSGGSSSSSSSDR